MSSKSDKAAAGRMVGAVAVLASDAMAEDLLEGFPPVEEIIRPTAEAWGLLPLDQAWVARGAAATRPLAHSLADRHDLEIARQMLARTPAVDVGASRGWDLLRLPDGHTVASRPAPGADSKWWCCTCGRPGGRNSCPHEWALAIVWAITDQLEAAQRDAPRAS